VRRALAALPASLVLLVLTALPAAADVAERPEAGTRGSFGGVALALVLGGLFAGAITYLAYRDVRFGADEAHQEDAHDLREGVGEHEVNA
jgi:hypothetical protein